MIKYQMTCAAGHVADIWFRDAATCDAQLAAGEVLCPTCGDTRMSKALMAPRLGAAREAPEAGAADPEPARPSTPPSPPPAPPPAPPSPAAMRQHLEARLRALRAHVEATAENTGDRFAQEARAMHEGEAEERPIYGQCSPEDAEALLEDGAPIAPLPWIDRRDD